MLLVLVGCALDAHPPAPPSVPTRVVPTTAAGLTNGRVVPPMEAVPSEMPFEISAMSGVIGDVAFDTIPYRVASDTAPDWDYVALFAEGEAGVAMAGIVVDGGLGQRTLVPGFRRTFTSDGFTLDGLQIGMIGCSGPEEAVWAYDRFADQVEIEVKEGPTDSQRTLDFTAEYITEGTTVRGSFSYDLF